MNTLPNPFLNASLSCISINRELFVILWLLWLYYGYFASFFPSVISDSEVTFFFSPVLIFCPLHVRMFQITDFV